MNYINNHSCYKLNNHVLSTTATKAPENKKTDKKNTNFILNTTPTAVFIHKFVQK